MLSYKIEGYNRVRNNLRRLAADAPKVIDDDMRVWAQGTRRALKSRGYPPKRPGQTYVRTGLLANSFKVVRKRKASYAIENSRKGASYVIGDEQARIHKGRWWTMREVINERTPELTRIITKSLVEVGNGD